MNRPTAPWGQAGYSDIVAAARQDDDLTVEFANGDVVRVAPTRIGITDPEFDVESGEDGRLSVRIVFGDGSTRDVSWMQIRSATDPLFAQELRHRDADQSRRIGLRLKALREDRNLSQRDLADLAGMTAPQLSKIEKGTSDLRVSTVQGLLRAMGARFGDIADPNALEVSRKTLRKRAELAGVSNDVWDRLTSLTPSGQLTERLSRAFGWRPAEITEGILTTPRLSAAVRFKARRSGQAHDSPILHLGFEVARCVRSAGRQPEHRKPPSNPAQIRAEAVDNSGRVTLPSLLTWMWNRGIPVVPLLGRGGFSAAVWCLEEEPIVVMKEARDLAVYWLFDLAHELGHISLGHVTEEAVVDIEAPEIHSSDDSEESAASSFALDLLLPNHRQLISAVRTQSRGSYLRFKFAVEDVATQGNVSAGLLGMVAAYELRDIGEDKDRWGSASNLARADGPGRPVAETIAAVFLPVNEMSEVDAALIRGAVLTGN